MSAVPFSGVRPDLNGLLLARHGDGIAIGQAHDRSLRAKKVKIGASPA